MRVAKLWDSLGERFQPDPHIEGYPVHLQTVQSAAYYSLLSIVLLAFILRIAFSLSNSLIHPDEIFQMTEPAHRLAFGYGVQTWEWREGIRSWVLPTVVAALMKTCSYFSTSSAAYMIPLKVALSAAALPSIWSCYAWVKRTDGLAAALVAALGYAVWYPLVAYASHPLSEVIAADCLVPGMYLQLFSGTSKKRLFCGSLLCGMALAVRVQLVPLVLFTAFWSLRACSARRFTIVLAGLSLPFVTFGTVDYFTWGTPFQSSVKYLYVNIVLGVSTKYGTKPWHWYISTLFSHYSILLALILPVFRRHLFIVLSILLLVGIYSCTAHKEDRFLYPVHPLLVIVICSGLVFVINYWARLSGYNMSEAQRVLIGSFIISVASLVLASTLSYWTNPAYAESAFQNLSTDPLTCGVALLDIPWPASGGYTMLNRNIPIVLGTNDYEASMKDSAVNTVVARDSVTVPRSFAKKQCLGDICTYRRQGACTGPAHDDINALLRRTGN